MSGFFMCSIQALQADISPTSFKVYCYYAISANNQTRASHKSKYTIAKDCGISRSTLRATKALCDHGLLKVEKRFDNGRQIHNRYILTDTPGQAAQFSFISPLSVKSSKLPRSGNKTPCGAAGLLKVIPQNHKNRSGNHGTSANVYRHCKLWVRRVLFLALFFAQMTPSPMSPVKHQRTTSMKKITLKQRKEKIISKVPKCMNLHLLTNCAGHFLHHAYKTKDADVPLCNSS